MLVPKETKYKKQFKKKINGITTRGHQICYGQYALKVLEDKRITAKQIEAARRAIMRQMKRLGYLWIRVFPDTPITQKPTETRMGKGKGVVYFWVARVRKGQILYEISVSGVSSVQAHQILQSGAQKLPVLTKIISR